MLMHVSVALETLLRSQRFLQSQLLLWIALLHEVSSLIIDENNLIKVATRVGNEKMCSVLPGKDSSCKHPSTPVQSSHKP